MNAWLWLALSAVPAIAVDDVRPAYVQTCDATHCWKEGQSSAPRERAYREPPPPTPGSIAYGYGREADALRRAGDWAGAESAYRSALSYDSRSRNGGIYAYQLGYCLLMQDRYEEALAAFRDAAPYYPEPYYIHDNSGWLYLKLGRREEAEREYRTAARLAPHNSGPQDWLVQMTGERTAAILDPFFEQARAELAEGRPERAEALWRRYLLVEPLQPAAHNNLAWALEQQGRLLEAEAEYREAERLSDTPEVYRSRAADLRSLPGYSDMLGLAKSAKFWSELAAGEPLESMKWTALRCFDDGCARSTQRPALRLVSRAPPAMPPPRAARADPNVKELLREREAAEERVRARAEALEAVWRAREKEKTEPRAIALLEEEHKTAYVERRREAAKVEEKLEKRYAELDAVPSKSPGDAAESPPDPPQRRALDCALAPALRLAREAGPEGVKLAEELERDAASLLADLRRSPPSGEKGATTVFVQGVDRAAQGKEASQLLVRWQAVRDETTGELRVDVQSSLRRDGRSESESQTVLTMNPSGEIGAIEAPEEVRRCLSR